MRLLDMLRTLLGLTLVAPFVDAAYARTTPERSSYLIEKDISAIKAESSASREKIALELRNFVVAVDPRSVDSAAIDEMLSLLDDKDGVVAGCAAESLAHLGPFANRAVPLLRRALDHVRTENQKLKFGPDWSPEEAFCIALLKVGGGYDRGCARNVIFRTWLRSEGTNWVARSRGP